MLIDDQRTQVSLRKIANGLTSDRNLKEDLVQEALVHLWLLEQRRPGQTHSWYLKSCKFHLQNFLACGRSVDAPKRRKAQVFISKDGEFLELITDGAESHGAVLPLVSARDILSLLSKRLRPPERAILGFLAHGLGMREIAKRLSISHTSVIKARRKIATQATRLGIDCPIKYPRNHTAF